MSLSNSTLFIHPITQPVHTHLHKPRKLQDFLNETSNNHFTVPFPINKRLNSSPSTTIQSLLLKFIKNVTFTSTIKKSPTFSPRIISRRLSKYYSRNKHTQNYGLNVTVKVRDILRWTSFSDWADEKPRSLETDTSPPHDQYYCTATTTSNTTTCSSNRSSWCDSDFTCEYLPSWSGSYCEDYGENDAEMGKKMELSVGDGFMEMTIKEGSFIEGLLMDDIKEQLWVCDDKEEQRNPKSLIDQKYQQEHDDEEESICSNVDDQLFLDLKCGLGNNKEACVREMEMSENWIKFEDIEKQELAVEIETRVLNALVDDLLINIFSN